MYNDNQEFREPRDGEYDEEGHEFQYSYIIKLSPSAMFLHSTQGIV